MLLIHRLKLYLVVMVFCTTLYGVVPPKLIIVMVLDQFAYRELQQQRASLKYGIKMLCDQGVFYHNAIMPNGLPKTGPGHAVIATGAYAKDHGIIDNDWYDRDLQAFVKADDDRSAQGVVFGVSDEKMSGKSPKNLKVDTLSDQLILDPSEQRAVYSLAFKHEPAIFMAGQLGKAIWFDEYVGKFTSSKAYFKALPDWLEAWNKDNASSVMSYLKKKKVGIKSIYYVEADHYVADLVKTCIRSHYAKPNTVPLILWFNLSGLDQEGHVYGPDSHEIKSRLHLLDRLVGQVLREAYAHVKKQDALIVLTSDHGVMPIPENVQGKGFDLAHRINSRVFKDRLNESLSSAHHINELVIAVCESSLYLDRAKLETLSSDQRVAVFDYLKSAVRAQEGIQDAWTFDELQKASFSKRDVRNYLKNQLYQGRSGDIIFLVAPYTLISKYPVGTSHTSPYDYDTHIPLIMYQKGIHERAQIFDRVYSQQLSVTLAYLLGVPRPSAATMDMLPGINFRTNER